MPRARKKRPADIQTGETPIAPVIEELARRYDLVPASEIPDPNLPNFADRVASADPARPHSIPAYENKTVAPFIGRVASGRGVTVTADGSSYAIESTHPLTAGQIALAQKQGFDDMSESQDGRIMVADKAEMRACNGDINWVARTVTGKESERSR